MYVSVDIETTGIGAYSSQILEVGAVIDLDGKTPVEQLPTFHCYIEREMLTGEPFALAMNAEIISRIARAKQLRDKYTFLNVEDVAANLAYFLSKHGVDPKHAVAMGKNFGSFDLQHMMGGLPNFKKYLNFKHRSIDPGSMYFKPFIDSEPPNTLTVMRRAGIAGEVAHTAVADAIAIIRAVRAHDDWILQRAKEIECSRQPSLLPPSSSSSDCGSCSSLSV